MDSVTAETDQLLETRYINTVIMLSNDPVVVDTMFPYCQVPAPVQYRADPAATESDHSLSDCQRGQEGRGQGQRSSRGHLINYPTG